MFQYSDTFSTNSKVALTSMIIGLLFGWLCSALHSVALPALWPLALLWPAFTCSLSSAFQRTTPTCIPVRAVFAEGSWAVLTLGQWLPQAVVLRQEPRGRRKEKPREGSNRSAYQREKPSRQTSCFAVPQLIYGDYYTSVPFSYRCWLLINLMSRMSGIEVLIINIRWWWRCRKKRRSRRAVLEELCLCEWVRGRGFLSSQPSVEPALLFGRCWNLTRLLVVKQQAELFPKPTVSCSEGRELQPEL